jgi:hypothetical protein
MFRFFISFYNQPQLTTMRSQRQAFEEAIITLVIRLSRYYDGRWFTIQDMRALLVAGRIKNELTDKHVMFAIRSRNDARMVDNRYGRKSTRYC